SRWFSSPRGLAVLWFAVLAGPLAWAADLGVSYALVQWTCGSQHTSVLHLMSVAALLVIAAGAVAAWRAIEEAPRDAPTEGGRPVDRGKFMAVWGLLSCALFSTVVIASAVPRWVLDACQ